MSQKEPEKYYYRIPGLLVPKTGIVYDAINADINSFIDAMPELITVIESNYSSILRPERRSFFIKNVERLCALLYSVYAYGLETDAKRLLRYVKEHDIDHIRNSMPSFVRDVLSLSVAMQKAQNLESKDMLEPISEIEIHANIIKNLATIENLINDTEYGEAKKITSDLVAYTPMDYEFVMLLDLIDTEKYDDAKSMINTHREKHTDSINQLAGTDLTKTILAVDDMPEALAFVDSALKEHYNIIAVQNAKAAYNVLKTKTPDLFLLDIDMPEIDGYELAQSIRLMMPYKETPIIFLTSNSTREHIRKAMLIGVDSFIVKPSSHEYLLTEVGKYLNT